MKPYDQIIDAAVEEAVGSLFQTYVDRCLVEKVYNENKSFLTPTTNLTPREIIQNAYRNIKLRRKELLEILDAEGPI